MNKLNQDLKQIFPSLKILSPVDVECNASNGLGCEHITILSMSELNKDLKQIIHKITSTNLYLVFTLGADFA
jgi:hypothetical protein